MEVAIAHTKDVHVVVIGIAVVTVAAGIDITGVVLFEDGAIVAVVVEVVEAGIEGIM